MSAPRKIWVDDVSAAYPNIAFVDNGSEDVCHHDYVVQELQLAAWEVNRLLNITHGRDLSWRQMLDGANGRLGRALAKIAQEG